MSVSGRFDFDFVDLVELSSAEFAECLRESVDDPDFRGLFVPVRAAAAMLGISAAHMHYLLRAKSPAFPYRPL
jgi:hypothetical protein